MLKNDRNVDSWVVLKMELSPGIYKPTAEIGLFFVVNISSFGVVWLTNSMISSTVMPQVEIPLSCSLGCGLAELS